MTYAEILKRGTDRARYQQTLKADNLIGAAELAESLGMNPAVVQRHAEVVRQHDAALRAAGDVEAAGKALESVDKRTAARLREIDRQARALERERADLQKQVNAARERVAVGRRAELRALRIRGELGIVFGPLADPQEVVEAVAAALAITDDREAALLAAVEDLAFRFATEPALLLAEVAALELHRQTAEHAALPVMAGGAGEG